MGKNEVGALNLIGKSYALDDVNFQLCTKNAH